jgi:hypothetical protein
MSDKKIPTVAEMRVACRQARDLIERTTLCLDATSDDYPIGGNDRRKCRLQVERAKGTGYRTVRTTTDKFGRWCKPHKRRCRDFCIVVIRN